MDNVSTSLIGEVHSNAVDLLRVEAAERARVVAMLQKLEDDIIDKINRNVGKSAITNQRLNILLAQTKDTIASAYGDVSNTNLANMTKVAEASAYSITNALNATVGIDVASVAFTEGQLTSLANQTYFMGRHLEEYWTKSGEKLYDSLTTEMRLGMLQGEGVYELTRRVAGTQAGNFQDGLMRAPRYQAEAIVRTATVGAANAGRTATYVENSDLLNGIQWVATLDDRVCEECAAIDGLVWDLPESGDAEDYGGYIPQGHEQPYPGPTLHVSCRCAQIPVMKSLDELKNDGQVSEAEAEEIDEETQAAMDGEPAQLSFDKWLTNKPPEFQDDLLGVEKATMFREGQIGVKDLVNQAGRPLTVDELAAKAGVPVVEPRPIIPAEPPPRFAPPGVAPKLPVVEPRAPVPGPAPPPIPKPPGPAPKPPAGEVVKRYHVMKRADYEDALRTGYLDPKKYTDKEIWTSKNPTEFYAKEIGGPNRLVAADEVEIEISVTKGEMLVPKGMQAGDTADRVARSRIPMDRVKVIPSKAPPTPPAPRVATSDPLLTTKVNKISLNTSSGINDSYIVEFEGGNKAIYKPISGESPNMQSFFNRRVGGQTIKSVTLAEREVATSGVAKILGLEDLVPNTVMRDIQMVKPTTVAPQPKLNFVQPRQSVAAGDVKITVNVSKLDKAFAEAFPQERVGPLGQGGIGQRYEKLQAGLRGATTVETPVVTLDAAGNPLFVDGRHRFAVLRDGGMTTIEVSVPKEQAASFAKKFAERQPVLEKGSVQQFVKDSKTAAEGAEALKFGKIAGDVERSASFDFLLGNTDRHANNYMVNQITGKIALIDNGAVLPNKGGFFRSALFDRAFTMDMKIPQDLVNKWRTKWDDIASYLKTQKFDEFEIARAKNRLDILSKYDTFKDLRLNERMIDL